ncbi:hypothetical protein IW256_002983 [Actinomadura viridis]|uniref:Uncharacterized protein n=1 Tax=Actinomadura viridis TaxID=58110 RepID=A0A931DEZ3_9ACTN|nr:hypothetical protein [Actinomadura viridis]
MELVVPSAHAAFPFTAPDLVTVQSMRPSESSWTCTWVKIASKVPSAAHRRYRSYTVFQLPYRSGRSRHGAPVASFHKIPFSTVR